MKRFLSLPLHALLLVCTLTSHGAIAQNAKRSAINPPPSAELNYTINANQHGLPLNGTAIVHWTNGDGHYAITTETRAMLLGKILEAKSEGAIDKAGLAPSTSTEKRYRKEATTTTFNRETNTITFSASSASYPIKGGEQDRNSIVWQLATIARSTPAKFKTGSTINIVVAGQKDADPWSFKVGKSEKIKSPLGDLNAVKVSKVVKDAGKEQKIDIWFAPSREWYPVRIRFSEPEGDFIEQTIASIAPQS
jgi:hypothetical protein